MTPTITQRLRLLLFPDIDFDGSAHNPSQYLTMLSQTKLSPHAKPAYDAYFEAINGGRCHPFESLPRDLQLAWSKAAEAAITSSITELESAFNPHAHEHLVNTGKDHQ